MNYISPFIVLLIYAQPTLFSSFDPSVCFTTSEAIREIRSLNASFQIIGFVAGFLIIHNQVKIDFTGSRTQGG